MRKIFLMPLGLSLMLLSAKSFGEETKNPDAIMLIHESSDVSQANNQYWNLTLTNSSGKRMYCKSISDRLYFSKQGDLNCDQSRQDTTVQLENLTLEANEVRTLPEFGRAKLREINAALSVRGLQFEYCPQREPLQFDCGYYCDNGRRYGESWDERISGGSLKKECKKDGGVDVKVTCDSGFDKRDGSTCMPRTCPGDSNTPNVAIGASIATKVFENGIHVGNLVQTCQEQGSFGPSKLECFEDYKAEGSSLCIHKSKYPEWSLTKIHSGCQGVQNVQEQSCRTSFARWCQKNYELNTGVITQVGAQGVAGGCLNAPILWTNNNEMLPGTAQASAPRQDVELVAAHRHALVNKCTATFGADTYGQVLETSDQGAYAACIKIIKSFKVSMREAMAFHSGCHTADLAYSADCAAGASNFCNSKGYTHGMADFPIPNNIEWTYTPEMIGRLSLPIQIVHGEGKYGTGQITFNCFQAKAKLAPFQSP